MKAEELFLAIGGLEQTRLEKTEQNKPARSGGKLGRRLLIAAVITTGLIGTAFAAVCFYLYDSPAQMLQGLYGENTGFDKMEPTQVSDPQKPWPNSMVQPGYEKHPIEETVAQELEQWVSPVGQTVETDGYKLTVDAFVYDQETRSGFVTLALEHEEPLDESRLQKQHNGGIYPYMVAFNQYGYAYQIPEKTTEHCLAMTYYFHSEMQNGGVLSLTLADRTQQETEKEAVDRTEQERSDYIAARKEELRQELTVEEAAAKLQELQGMSGYTGTYDDYYFLAAYEFDQAHRSQWVDPLESRIEGLQKELTPEQAEQKLRKLWGDDWVEEVFAGQMEFLQEAAYRILAEREEETQPQPNRILISLPESLTLPNRTFGNGDVLINTLCVRINDEKYALGGSAEFSLNMKDGSVFVVRNGQMDNTLFQLGVEKGFCLCMLNSAVNTHDIVSVTVVPAGTGRSVTLLPD